MGEMERVQDKDEILSYLRSQKEQLRLRYHVRAIALVGSFARGSQEDHSDIDFIVDLEETTPDIYGVKRALRAELARRFGRPVDIASVRYLKPYCRERVLREAIYA